MDKVIEVNGLVKRYGDLTAVDGVSFDVYAGDVYGFLGPNGAGKSTTIRMLLSLIKPDAGSIRLFGKDIRQNHDFVMQRVGCIVEKPDFYKFLSAKDNLRALARYNQLKVSEHRLDDLLDFVGLAGRGAESVKGYSHGMRQRLGIAQALLHDPQLIILDEPTTGLDPQGIIDIRNLIILLSKEKGKTILLSSHILHELELVATRLAIMNKGRMVAQGELKTLLSDAARIVRFGLDRPTDALTLIRNDARGLDVHVVDDMLEVTLDLNDIPELVRKFSDAGFLIFSVESKRQLEDYFLKLTESAERMQLSRQAVG
jgi:ABC-type multidrug transport system ATPase subunit